MALRADIDPVAMAPSTAVASADELVRRAQSLIPSLRERAVRIAETRRQPDDVVRDLHELELVELLRPHRYGGRDLGVDAVYRVARELSKGDGSTSWVYLVTAAHDVFMGLFPAAVQEEYWSSPRPCGASSYAPTGKATPADGGFVLSGKWSFCSGIDHAGWVLLGGIVGMLEPNRPDMRYFLVREGDYEIVDDWYVMGLRGTGSKSVVLNNCFVPNERIITFQQIITGRPTGTPPNDTSYRESIWMTIGFSLIGPATGIAQTAYEVVVKDLRDRIARRDPVFGAKKSALQIHLAEASTLVATSDLLFSHCVQATSSRMAARVRLTNEERVRIRRDSVYSVVTAKKAVEILMSLTGGHGQLETHPVQRALRDLYAMSAHPAVGWDSPALSYGAFELDGAPTELMI
jgi:3-hydroxy-9,10-secoandrosta-1,3,5(10)-triene-9,17-dione monooxygenase